MRRSSILCCLLMITFVVTVGCKRDSTQTEQSANTPNDQSMAQPQPSTPPSVAEQPAPPPVVAEQPPPPAPEPKPATPAKKKPVHTATAKAPPPPPPKPPQPTFVVVPAGTVLGVRLDQPISTKSNKTGDTFTATLSDAVAVEGVTVIPRGAQVAGVVAEAASAGRMKGSAKLALQLTKIAVGQTPYQITASMGDQTTKGRGKRTAVAAGGGAGAGALIGGIAGGGKGAAIGALVGGSAGTVGSAMTGERDISLPAEQSLSFKLEQPLRIQTTTPSHTAAQQ